MIEIRYPIHCKSCVNSAVYMEAFERVDESLKGFNFLIFEDRGIDWLKEQRWGRAMDRWVCPDCNHQVKKQ